jgi:hypothetical protein
LRERGFSRADTERMRHLLEAFVQMLTPSPRVRRLALRPYFSEALRFYGMVAPNYRADPAMLRRYLDEPNRHPGGRSSEQAGALSSTGAERRRRRRRSARRHRRGAHGLLRPGFNGGPQGNPCAGDVTGDRAVDGRNQAKLCNSPEPGVTPPR